MHGDHLDEWVRELHSALDDKLGLELLEVSAERVVGRMPVEGNTQVIGIWHGGASGVLVETLGSVGALAHARRFNEIAVGVDLSVTHHRPVRSGFVTGVATPLHAGRSVATYAVELSDDKGRRIATGRVTCQLVARP